MIVRTLCILLMFTAVSLAEQADLLLKNGQIITMETDQPSAQALAIRGDKIVWLGDEKDASRWIGQTTRVIDLAGTFVYPGVIDSHAHVVSLGASRLQIDLNDTPNKGIIAERVKDRVQKARPNEWIEGRGWDQNEWPEKNFPTAADLDPVSPQNPVVLERTDGHAVWVNTKTLQIAGITKATKDPDGGKIIRDANQNPTGVFVDTAADLIYSKMKELSQQEIKQRVNIALKESVQKGITMIHDAGIDGGQLEAYKSMAASDQLPVRIYAMILARSKAGEEFLKNGRPQNFGPYLDVRSVKLIMDGAMGSRGAAFLEPYSDDPGNTGLLLWKQDEFMDVLHNAKARGIQVNIHAIGDRANRIVLDGYEKIGVKGLRWRIEHVQVLAPSDVPRLAQLGIIASMQPIHATADGPWATDRVGPERIKGAYAWRSLLNYKTIIAAGSDAPVEDINPLWGIYAAITRQDHQGKPEGGWHPEQNMNRMEALRAFTMDAAYAAFRENETGSLKPGKLADLVVVPENLMNCAPRDLVDMKVLYTIVGGRIRYQAR